MCSCGLSNRTSFTTIIKQDGSSLPTLKYLHCKYKQQFESIFSNILGIPVSEATLPALANLADTGGDVKGTLTDKGKPIYFSVENALKQIDSTKIENNTCSI